MFAQITMAEREIKAASSYIRQFDKEGNHWDALLPAKSKAGSQRLYTLSNRFRLDYWSLEFRTFWGRRTHGRQGHYDRVGNFVYGGCFK